MKTHYLVCYDITEDDVRYKVAGVCQNFGLVRIQYSVFYGYLERSQLSTLELELKKTLNEGNGDIHILKVCSACERDHKILTSISIANQDSIVEEVYEEIAEELDAYNGVLVL